MGALRGCGFKYDVAYGFVLCAGFTYVLLNYLRQLSHWKLSAPGKQQYLENINAYLALLGILVPSKQRKCIKKSFCAESGTFGVQNHIIL